MKDVHLLINKYIVRVVDEEEGTDEWRYHGTELWEGRVVSLHTTRLDYRDLPPSHSYEHTPYTRPVHFRYFQLEAEAEYGYVVSLRSNSYSTFGGREGFIEAIEVFSHEDDAKDFTEKLQRHFSESSPILFPWGPSIYSLFQEQAYDIRYEKFKVE